MADSLEDQIRSISNKNEMHKWIDAMPDDACGIAIVLVPQGDESKNIIRYLEFGGVTAPEAIYCVRSYEHWVFGDIHATE